MSDGYSSMAWQCPFFVWDEKQKIHCEGGTLKFCKGREKSRYAHQYCANFSEWKMCTLSQFLLEKYEREEREHGKKG